MRKHSAVVVVVWAGCSALCVSAVAYLGAGSPDRSPWLAAGVVAAVLGAAGGTAAVWGAWPERRVAAHGAALRRAACRRLRPVARLDGSAVGQANVGAV